MTRENFLLNLQKIGYSRSNAYAIINGTRSITRAMMKKAKDDFGIAYDYWDALPLNSQTIPTQAAQSQVDEEKENHTRSAA